MSQARSSLLSPPYSLAEVTFSSRSLVCFLAFITIAGKVKRCITRGKSLLSFESGAKYMLGGILWNLDIVSQLKLLGLA